jgi:GT2 family glycosyltransferase
MSKSQASPQQASTLVVVLNWNGDQDLIECLDSLETARAAAAQPYDVLVLDNASTSGAFDRVTTEYPWVYFLRLSDNRYWAGGNNAAVQWALEREYEWIVLSNSDIVTDQTWYPALLETARVPGVGAVGFKIFGEAQRVPIKLFEDYRSDFSLGDLQWHEDLYISGCFLAVRSRCFKELGGFDEVYKMYCEEFDFLSRVRVAGWQTVRCNAPIYHVSELASRKVPLLTAYFAIRNNIRVMLKLEPQRAWRPLKYAVKVLLRMVNPAEKVDFTDSCRRREKPTDSILTNLAILLWACAWNIVFLPSTLLAGRRDTKAAILSRSASSK